jgi:dipeptidyl aminopeptidase/acylaminoacyl peptidase
MKRFMHLPLVASLVLFSVIGQNAIEAQTKRGITPEDYLAFQFVSDPHLSPDGKVVAYVVTTINQKKNRRDSAVWSLAIESADPPRRLSAEGFSSSMPRWSPDGKTLAILSARNLDPTTEKPKSQIYLLPIRSGGEAMALTNLKNGVEGYQWSPDGTKIVVVSASVLNDDIAVAGRKSDVRHYSHIIYKSNDSGWDEGKRQHLWVVDVGGAREARQITDGQEWNDTDPQWSPDSTRVAFVSDRTGKAYDDSHNTDVWVIPASGGSLIKISDHDFEDVSPRWSPDGKQIIFAGKTNVHQFPKLYLADSSGGRPSQLALKDLDVIPTQLEWSSAGLLFQANIKGEAQIFRADLATHAFEAVTNGPRRVQSFDTNSAASKLVYLANDFQHLDDLYVSNLDGKSERQLTHLNTTLWKQLDLQTVERLPYLSSDGLPIDGFLVKPLGWQPGKRYPMVLVIHGGPRDMFGVDWNNEFQIFAAQGWAVFFCNPRGSIGYGEKFERGQINNWGVMDYQDVMSGVDAALKHDDWIDPNSMGVTGGSYGGFMTNWIISHTNRFKAAVTLRSLSNFISDEGTRQGPYGHSDYFKDIMFDDFDQYWAASPLKYARNVKTPTLILHSEMDFQLPFEQAEQWFRALQHYGVTSEFVLFPRENHNLTRTGEPKHIVESFKWQIYWFDRYLNGNTGAKSPDAP